MHSSTDNRKRFTLWTLFYGVMGLIVAFLLFSALLLSIWSYGQARRVDELVADIRANGEPATGEELAQYVALAPEVDDVTKLWLEGIEALQLTQVAPAGQSLPFVGESAVEEKPLPKIGEPWPELAACNAFLKANQFSLDKFHEAARRGGYARFPADYSQGYALALPAAQGVRSAARILRLELEVRAHQRDASGAAEAMRALLVLPRAQENDPTMVSYILKIAFDGLATRALADKLCLVSFTDQELLEFQQIVRSNDPENSLRTALIGERALGYSTMLKPELMINDRPSSLDPFHADKVTYLLFMNELITASEEGLPALHTAIGNVERDMVRKARSWAGKWTVPYTASLFPGAGAVWESTARELSFLRALDAGIAVELHGREKGELPNSLTELSPKLLPAPPIDPYTGGAMIYTKSADGFAIYGFGKNKKDDGGAFDLGKTSDDGFHFPLK